MYDPVSNRTNSSQNAASSFNQSDELLEEAPARQEQALKVMLDKGLVREVGTGPTDPWPYVNCLLFILKTAYGELADRVGDIKAPRGSKTEMILAAIERLPRQFAVAQLEKACPGVSREMVRRVLGSQKGKRVKCIGRGPGALWTKIGSGKKG